MRHIGVPGQRLGGHGSLRRRLISKLRVFQGLPGLTFLVSLPLMALGALLLFGEEHAHTHIHVHGTITHEHIHAHDRGHKHEH